MSRIFKGCRSCIYDSKEHDPGRYLDSYICYCGLVTLIFGQFLGYSCKFCGFIYNCLLSYFAASILDRLIKASKAFKDVGIKLSKVLSIFPAFITSTFSVYNRDHDSNNYICYKSDDSGYGIYAPFEDHHYDRHDNSDKYRRYSMCIEHFQKLYVRCEYSNYIALVSSFELCR